jgi:hypothetical protein
MVRCWGVVQLVGHLTVNEDGEGSNPSAPAKSFPSIAMKLASADLRRWEAEVESQKLAAGPADAHNGSLANAACKSCQPAS